MNEVGQWVVENWPWALPLWQWFKVNWDKVVGVISLVLAVIFFLNQRQTKQLDYILSSHHWVYSFPTRLFLSNNRKSVGPTWRLQVDGKEVRSLDFTRLPYSTPESSHCERQTSCDRSAFVVGILNPSPTP